MYLQVFIYKYLIRESSNYTIYNFYVFTGIYLQVFNKRIFKIYTIYNFYVFTGIYLQVFNKRIFKIKKRGKNFFL